MDSSLYYQQLRQTIETHFDLEELRTLSFDLGIPYDELSGDRLSSRTVALVEYVRKRGQMTRLIAALARERPSVDWPQWVEESEDQVFLAATLPATDPDNPFGRRGMIQDSADYLVRQPLTGAVMHELQKGVSLSIVGPSQTGKSSLLWYVTRFGPRQMDLPPQDFIYLGMELVHSEDDLFDYICGELEIETARGFRLARLLKGRKIILCLDEIEKMTWEGFSLNVRTELRGLADGANAPFVLAIASRSPLSQLFPDSPEMTSPLAGLCLRMDMPMFTLAETHALVAHYLKDRAQTLPQREVENAWKDSNGHPRDLQMALREAFNQMMKGVDV